MKILGFIRNKSTNIFKSQKPINMQQHITIEQCKAKAARKAVDDNINTNYCIIGIGSGTTMCYVLERLKEVCREKDLCIKCIPSSLQSKQLIYDYELPITELDMHPVIDVTIDGADEVDENFVAIKGGGGCHFQEKIIAHAAKKFVVVADYRKDSKQLGESWQKGIPIEVSPMALRFVRQRLASILDVKSLDDFVIRTSTSKAGPVITDHGNLILDWKFNPETYKNYKNTDWDLLATKIKNVPGVLETGIFANIIKEVYFGQADGSVVKKEAKF